MIAEPGPFQDRFARTGSGMADLGIRCGWWCARVARPSGDEHAWGMDPYRAAAVRVEVDVRRVRAGDRVYVLGKDRERYAGCVGTVAFVARPIIAVSFGDQPGFRMFWPNEVCPYARR